MGGINAGWGPTLLVRAQGNISAAAQVLRDRVRAAEPGIRVGAPRTLISREQARTVIERFTRSLLLVLAILAMILACLGIYGVASYSVEQRTREIGIRIALGATQANVTKLVIGRTILATALGASAGIAGAAALSRFIKGFLYEASVWSPGVMVGVLVVLGFTAFLATMAPAIRATNVDPAISLRQD